VTEERQKGLVGVIFGVICLIAVIIALVERGFVFMVPVSLLVVFAGILFVLVRRRR